MPEETGSCGRGFGTVPKLIDNHSIFWGNRQVNRHVINCQIAVKSCKKQDTPPDPKPLGKN